MSKKPLIDKDGEVRELTADDLKKFKPLSEAKPALYAKIKKGVGERGAQKSPTKIPISIRMSPKLLIIFEPKVKVGKVVLTAYLKSMWLITNKNF